MVQVIYEDFDADYVWLCKYCLSAAVYFCGPMAKYGTGLDKKNMAPSVVWRAVDIA